MENNEQGVTNVDINQEMREAYLQYSMSVIVGRALPDVRDGLKPVHRRILYAMKDLGNTHDKAYKKSARVVGDVIGKYHPHGDIAVYDSMVRMAQDFSMRYPLIDGQGNFGSIDGDSPAAQRYTEVRMTRLVEEILEDIDKETVPFGPNYDDSLLVPHVLPAKFPNLLVNGSSGIAVGMATNIPPHNLGEVIDGCIKVIEEPTCTVDDLIKIIPGPDFPTAGVIAGTQGIIEAYKRGRGIISLKAVAEIVNVKDREEIIITEIPYMVNKAKMIEHMAELVKEKKVEGISDIRDESSKEGLRVVIQIKRNENASVILNRLYKYTQMQVSFGIIMLALDARNQPVTFDLKKMLSAFIDHRKDVVTKRCIFDLKKAQARLHILEGLNKAIDQIDAVIAMIKAAKEPHAARTALMDKFSFSEKQATAILEMRLQRLTGLERKKIQDEMAELLKTIEWLEKVLGDVKEIFRIIVTELTEIKEKYADKRRTQIEGAGAAIEDEDLISSEDVFVTVTDTGYIKRVSMKEYRTQNRGGRGLKGAETREDDFVSSIFVANTKTTLLVFTDKGKLYWLKVYKLPEGSRTAKGKAIVNLLSMSSGEKVRAILPVKEFSENNYVVMVTKNGIIKKTSLDAFSNPRPSGIIALTTDLNDRVIDCMLSDGQSDVFICTKDGMSIRFEESDVRPMGRSARGVKAIALGKDDEVVGMAVINKDFKGSILLVTEKGYGKRTLAEEYRSQSRAGVGIITQKVTDKVGNVVRANLVHEDDEVIVTTNKGQAIRMRGKQISLIGRNTQGVRVLDVPDGEMVTGFAVIKSAGGDEDESSGNGAVH